LKQLRFTNEMQEVLAKILPNVLSFREKLHRHPELGYEEHKTTDLIVRRLGEIGIDKIETKYSKTGVVGIIEADKAQRTIAIRADIDALPLKENSGAPFASENEGIMHACGHDVHTSIVIGVAELLQHFRDKLNVNVKLIFQPAEECSPEGGAKTLIANGVLHGVDAIVGLHVWPRLPVGAVGVVRGSAMAASDKLKISIFGQGAHAAEPQNGIDAIMIATQVVNAINSFRARTIDPFEPVVLSLGTINSRGRYNIICPQVDIEGTIRTLNEDTRCFIGKKLVEIVASAAEAMDGSGEINILRGYDVLKNDEKLTNRFTELTKSLLGDDKVLSNVKPSMISEDFAFYAKQVPATYFFLGCESPHPLHSSQFLPNEGCIEIGIKVLTNLVLNDFLGIDEKQSQTF